MAFPGLVRAATAPPAGGSVPAPPARAYARSIGSAEKALESTPDNMQPGSEVRHRQPRALSPSALGRQDSTETTGATLILSASENADEQARQRPTTPPAANQRVLDILAQDITFKHRGKDSSEIPDDRQRCYGKIKHNHLEKDNVEGIPRLSALLDSNDSFCMFRRFGDEAARILLAKEIELDQLVQELRRLDKSDEASSDLDYRLHSVEYKDTWEPTQKILLDKIEEKLDKYYGFLLKYTDVRALGRPQFRHHRGVYDYILDNRPLYEEDEAFFYPIDDFIIAKRSSGNRTEGGPILENLESLIAKRPRWGIVNWLFKSKSERRKSENELIHHYSERRLSIAQRILVAILAVGIMLIPVFVLFLDEYLSRGKMACVVGSFVVVFMVTICTVVDITPHDLFIGIAAYSAVLVALLANIVQGSASSAAGASP